MSPKVLASTQGLVDYLEQFNNDKHSYCKCGDCGQIFYENSLFDLIKTMKTHFEEHEYDIENERQQQEELVKELTNNES